MDADLPSIFEVKYRFANKPHICCECRRTIAKGVKYQYVSGLWNGKWDKFKTCLACVELREALVDDYDKNLAPFKELSEWAYEYREPFPPEEIIVIRKDEAALLAERGQG